MNLYPCGDKRGANIMDKPNYPFGGRLPVEPSMPDNVSEWWSALVVQADEENCSPEYLAWQQLQRLEAAMHTSDENIETEVPVCYDVVRIIRRASDRRVAERRKPV